MSNFTFIEADFPDLYVDAVEAEKLAFISPTSTAVFCRSTFENAVNWLYDHDANLTRPWLWFKYLDAWSCLSDSI